MSYFTLGNFMVRSIFYFSQVSFFLDLVSTILFNLIISITTKQFQRKIYPFVRNHKEINQSRFEKYSQSELS